MAGAGIDHHFILAGCRRHTGPCALGVGLAVRDGLAGGVADQHQGAARRGVVVKKRGEVNAAVAHLPADAQAMSARIGRAQNQTENRERTTHEPSKHALFLTRPRGRRNAVVPSDPIHRVFRACSSTA